MASLTIRDVIRLTDPERERLVQRCNIGCRKDRRAAIVQLRHFDHKKIKYMERVGIPNTPVKPGHKLGESKIILPQLTDWKIGNGNLLLDPKRVTGDCYMCGQNGPLNKEHIPPYSSGNIGRVRVLEGTNLAAAHQIGIFDFTKFSYYSFGEKSCKYYTDGVSVKRLCPPCNRQYNYAPEYKNYTVAAKSAIANSMNGKATIQSPRSSFIGLVKQVLSMFLVNCSPVFYDKYRKDVVKYIMDRSDTSFWLPPGLKIWFGVYDGALARRVGVKSVTRPPDNIWYGEVSFAPFIFVLSGDNATFKSLKEINHLADVSITVPVVNFPKFDVTADAGFDYNNSLCLESVSYDQDFLYCREKY